VDQFYEKTGSLFVEAYDAFYSSSRPKIADDVAFYERLSREVGGPILELGCGTGRIALPLANAGSHVPGVDRSEAMLTVARRKLTALPAPAQERLTLVNQHMSALNLDRGFGFVFVPFRSFQHLLTIDLQKKVVGSHAPPSGANRPVGPSLVRSSSRFADRREHQTAGAFRHPSRDRASICG
jgi:SAM-dependent methyltransferase